jgi:hypothetical protein
MSDICVIAYVRSSTRQAWLSLLLHRATKAAFFPLAASTAQEPGHSRDRAFCFSA